MERFETPGGEVDNLTKAGLWPIWGGVGKKWDWAEGQRKAPEGVVVDNKVWWRGKAAELKAFNEDCERASID